MRGKIDEITGNYLVNTVVDEADLMLSVDGLYIFLFVYFFFNKKTKRIIIKRKKLFLSAIFASYRIN